MKEWIKNHRNISLELIFKMVNVKLRGHYQYYGVMDNTRLAYRDRISCKCRQLVPVMNYRIE